MKINKELLLKHIADGYIIYQKHPTLDLTIYNYSQFTQYENKWDDITLMARGLILDSEFNIIQRPFGKFFNIEEHMSEYKPNIPNLPFEVYDKMDGSLGILYWDADKPYIASRGSFTSEQALEGTKMLHEKYKDSWNNIDKTKTYVYEIIYEKNRIVIDYGNKWELVLLGIIDTETGEDLPLEDIGFPIVERYNGIKDFDKLKALELNNKEGFVIKYSNGFRMKLKFDEYCRLHRIITNVTSYDIWECLRHGTGFDEILDKVPDEFYTWVKETKLKIESDFLELKQTQLKTYLSDGYLIAHNKVYAEWAKKQKYPNIMFSLRTGKQIEDVLWRIVKPKYEKPFSSK